MPARCLKSAAPNKRRGLQPLSCHDCGAKVYLTWAQAERHGMPVCSCGNRFEPDDYELAMALELDGAASLQAFERARQSAARGQAGKSARWGAVSADGTPWRTPEMVAHERVEQERRDAARAARLAAIQPVPDPMPF